MFCPRCGRPVSPTANFCGGCGLPKAEIEKVVQPQVEQVQPVQQITEAEVNELNSALSQLEGDLTGINPVENYTTDTAVITNTDTAQIDEIAQEIKLTVENQYEQQEKVEENVYGGQSEYSRNTPQHPYYTKTDYTQPQPVKTVEQPEIHQDQTLTTVDFVWMMLISSVPVVNVFYIIYQAFVQKESITKRSWARATMIVYLFAVLLGLVFSMGIMLTSFIYW